MSYRKYSKKELKSVETLSMLDQIHLLKFYDELSAEQRETLFEQIENLDFTVLNEDEVKEKRGKIEPIGALTLKEIESRREYYRQIGINAIQKGKVGAVLLAGGQGSRLGFDKPKGMFNIGVNRDLYIFECLINNLLEVVKETDTWIPLFIMTSPLNNEDTQKFFEENNHFGYSKDNIIFFVQDQLPTVNLNGKLMLADKDKVCTAPNGNGGWYESMAKTGMLNIIKKTNIEWLNVFSVDNVLQKIADPCFIGAVINSGKVSGSKVVAKAEPEEKVGVMCLEDGKPSIIEYYEMTNEMITQRKSDGTLSYNYGVILNYLFRVDKLNNTLKVKLPLHRAFKKIKYMNSNGEVVSPESPNAYKFENLALDMVKLQDECLAYEVDRNKEFAPVKNKMGVDSVDTARELLRLNGVEL